MKRFYVLNKDNKQFTSYLYKASDSSVVTIIANEQNELTKSLTEYLVRHNHNLITFEYSPINLEAIIEYAQKNFRHVGLISHSDAAYLSIILISQNPNIKHFIAIATLPNDSQELSNLEIAIANTRCPKLFCHGTADEIIPNRETESLFKLAKEPKQLFLCLDADHQFSLKRHRENLCQQISNWLSSIY